MFFKEKEKRTHRIEPPCVFQLILAPLRGYARRLLVSEVLSELFGDAFGGEERAVDIKSEDELFLRRHAGDVAFQLCVAVR
jgi:hypothetical protein